MINRVRSFSTNSNTNLIPNTYRHTYTYTLRERRNPPQKKGRTSERWERGHSIPRCAGIIPRCSREWLGNDLSTRQIGSGGQQWNIHRLLNHKGMHNSGNNGVIDMARPHACSLLTRSHLRARPRSPNPATSKTLTAQARCHFARGAAILKYSPSIIF